LQIITAFTYNDNTHKAPLKLVEEHAYKHYFDGQSALGVCEDTERRHGNCGLKNRMVHGVVSAKKGTALARFRNEPAETWNTSTRRRRAEPAAPPANGAEPSNHA
jgi:hypothetical protein